MNVVTFNNSIQPLLDSYPDRNYINPFNGWQHAPLFDYATTYNHEKEQVAALIDSHGMHIPSMPWPFEVFRLGLAETAVPWNDGQTGVEIGEGRYLTDYVVTRKDGQCVILAEIKEMWDRKAVTALMGRPRPKTAFLICDTEPSEDGRFQFQFSTHLEGRWITIPRDTQGSLGTIVNATLTALATFLFDAMTPTTHIATVTPNKPCKSVQWVKARTHYTLVTHGHPANQNSVQAGQRVPSSTLEELHRMAHNRRAHKRTLRHERYRFARGKVIDVRATWVGPKEWQDQGGRQIYRILEPVVA